MADLAETLRRKRLLIVTGKGGTGKSTIAAALGLAAAGLGLRTLVAELSGQRRVAHILGCRGAGTEQVRLSRLLTTVSIDPRDALREYLRLQLGPLGAALTASRTIGYLTGAAPGLSELVTIGKVWELAGGRHRAPTSKRHDLVIVDGPSSGHCLALVRSPTTFAQIAPAGPVARQARAIAGTLAAADVTGALIVTLAEELSVSETLMLRHELERAPGIVVDGVLVNRVCPRRFDGEDARKVKGALRAAPDPLHRTALRAALSQHARRGDQERQLARLSACTDGGATLELPPLPGRPPDRAALELLGERLLKAER